MKKQASFSHSAPFLVELMAVILFFSLSATVILSLFVSASKRGDEASRLGAAANAAMEAAEIVRLADEPGSAFLSAYSGEDKGAGIYEAGLDEGFLPGGSEYVLRLEARAEGGLWIMSIDVLMGDEEIYSINSLANYVKGGGA